MFIDEILVDDKSNSQSVYRLLDHTNVDVWGMNLPVKLKRNHSFWMRKTENIIVILLRPLAYSKRNIKFIVVIKESKSHVYKIPKHRSLEKVENLLMNVDQFDLLLSPMVFEDLTRVLEKFEDRKYIHYFLLDNKIKIEFPRYGLEFEYDNSCYKSLNFQGYKLRNNQNLSGTLYKFSNYLVLDLISPDSVNNIGNSKIILIVPKGEVSKDSNHNVNILVPSEHFKKLSVSVFYFHNRFEKLFAKSIEERLHLAAIYAATSTLLYEPLTNRTGSELAIELLRQSWKNSPYTEVELLNLINLSIFNIMQPSILLLCNKHYNDSIKVEGLYNPQSNSKNPFVTATITDAMNEYKNQNHLFPFNIRSKLVIEEELSIFSDVISYKKNKSDMTLEYSDKQGVIKNYSKFLNQNEDELNLLLVEENEKFEDFPLLCSNERLKQSIGSHLVNELKESWNTAKTLKKYKLKDFEISKLIIKEKLNMTLKKKEELENYLYSLLEGRSLKHRLLQIANVTPRLTKEDLLKFSYQKNLIKEFNIDLSDKSLNYIQDLIIVWEQFCVFEDKLKRLLSFVLETNDKATQEILVKSKWDPKENPLWLLFEVENELKIRNEQYELIEQILSEPDTISQLNMGLGKTKVVMPCLILYLSNRELDMTDKSNLVRVFILSEIFNEQFSYLHLTLCASILNKKIFQIPFHRQVNLNEDCVNKIYDTLKYCQAIGGFLVLRPEDFGSMILKKEELYVNNLIQNTQTKIIINKLQDILTLPYYDILDESDEILHYRKQIVYSIGSQEQLKSRIYRCEIVQELLLIFRHNQEIGSILSSISTRKQDNISHFEYDQLLLLPSKELDHIKPKISELILNILINSPSESFNWIRRVKNIEKVKNFILKSSIRENEFIRSHEFSDIKYFEMILMLRGMLGMDILYHCLQKIYNVQFGLLHEENRNKFIAVPYLGADSPSERSEFSHPDCAIIYTTISWYNYGINRSQLKEVFYHLLACGESKQEYIYNTFFKLIKEVEDEDSEELIRINSIRKIDLSNEIQLNILEKYYCRNMKVINYFLNYFVYPDELMIFRKN